MKKIKVLALVMVFAFAALGGAYAWWSDSITVNETVKTGVVNIKWVAASSNDTQSESSDPAYPTGGSSTDPNLPAGDTHDVGSISWGSWNDTKMLSDDDEFTDSATGKYAFKNLEDEFNFTLTNGYPGYTAYVWAEIKNVGTIPVKLQDLELKKASDPNYDDWLDIKYYLCNADKDEATKTAIKDYILDVNQSVWIRFEEKISEDGSVVPQGAGYNDASGAIYTGIPQVELQWGIKAVQWNATTPTP